MSHYFPDDYQINDDELFYRNVHPQNIKEGKITSQTFRDDDGLSVDRGCGRSINEIKESFESRNFKVAAILELKKTTIDELGLTILIKKLPENPFHCEIWSDRNNSKLTKSIAHKLRDRSTEVYRAAGF